MGVSVVRSWRRAALGASGVGLLVPVALLAALAVTASVGGSGSIGGLAQLFGGPTVPRASQGGLPRDVTEGRTGGDVPAVPRARQAVAGARESARRRAAARSVPDRGDAPTAQRRGRTGPITARPRPQAPATAPTAPTPTPPAPEPEPEPPARPTNPVRRIGSALADTVRQLPVVGEPAGDAVQTVVDLVAPPRTRSAPAPEPAPAAPAPAPAAPPPPAPAPPAAATVVPAAAPAP